MTADPRAVEIIADALKDHALLRFKGLRYGCEGCDWSRPWDDDEALEDYEAHLGRVAVAVLEAAGWSLLPPGGQSYVPDGWNVGGAARLPAQYGPLSQVTGVVVSIDDDGFATVDLGEWGRVGCLVELLRPAPPEAAP